MTAWHGQRVSCTARHFESRDQFQEQLQDEFYEHVGDTDAGFEDPHVAEVIAPNTFNFLCCKKNIQQSLGLAKRAGKHAEHSADIDIIRLLVALERKEAPNLVLDRTYSTVTTDRYKVDHLGKGLGRLADGKFESWGKDTSRVRCPNKDTSSSTSSGEVRLEGNEKDDDAFAEEEDEDTDEKEDAPDEDEVLLEPEADRESGLILESNNDKEWDIYGTTEPEQ
ncbi:hypothetical protein V5O48_012697 [Marasmius crinis-equi]|uniref:Uncharacterized protein n=1 Tax=Marasmius crinis-equi TaxID=585013 RepID=A0ABR3F223_9AGAR